MDTAQYIAAIERAGNKEIKVMGWTRNNYQSELRRWRSLQDKNMDCRCSVCGKPRVTPGKCAGHRKKSV